MAEALGKRWEILRAELCFERRGLVVLERGEHGLVVQV